jgi:hypothetical protein
VRKVIDRRRNAAGIPGVAKLALIRTEWRYHANPLKQLFLKAITIIFVAAVATEAIAVLALFKVKRRLYEEKKVPIVHQSQRFCDTGYG